MKLERKPCCCVSAAQQQPQHWCFNNPVLATNMKHRAMWAAIRKVTSISARSGTGGTERKSQNLKNLAN